MKLLVDIGNSRIKWAWQAKETLSEQQSFLYRSESLEKMSARLEQDAKTPDEIWVSNVAGPEIADSLTQWAKSTWNLIPHFAVTQKQADGVTNGYQQYQQLGVDRWLALIGAHHCKKQTTCCIVDCGTAVTIDVVSTDGQHQGGLIAPGMTTMRRSLLTDTYALSNDIKCAFRKKTKFLADNTQECITIGTLYALIGLIEHIVNRIEQQPVALMLTGGDVPLLLPLLRQPCHHIPDLVLQGLAITVSKPI